MRFFGKTFCFFLLLCLLSFSIGCQSFDERAGKGKYTDNSDPLAYEKKARLKEKNSAAKKDGKAATDKKSTEKTDDAVKKATAQVSTASTSKGGSDRFDIELKKLEEQTASTLKKAEEITQKARESMAKEVFELKKLTAEIEKSISELKLEDKKRIAEIKESLKEITAQAAS